MKKRVVLTFNENGKNGGPYISHTRIMNSELKNDFEFIPLYLPRIRRLLAPTVFFEILRELKKLEVDIFQSSGLQFEGFVYVLLARLAGIKNVVIAIRGSSKDAIYLGAVKKSIILMFESLSLSLCKSFYTVSDYVSEWSIVKKYNKKYYGTIYNLPDNKIREAASISIREELSIDNDDIIIVSTGRITRDKGFELLKDVIHNTSYMDKIQYLIIGEGSYLEEMKNELKYDNIHFLGYRNDVQKILEYCDIFVLCSYHETLCNSAIEASAHGLPAVVSSVGGLKEVVEHNSTGFLVEELKPENFSTALNVLISDEKLRQEMSEKAFKMVEERFSTKRITAQLKELYIETLECN